MEKIELISLSGKMGSGKDLVGEIIQEHIKENSDVQSNNTWHIKKFADKLKDNVCNIIGCTREDLESRDFKNSPIEGWSSFRINNNGDINNSEVFISHEDAISSDYYKLCINPIIEEKKMTARSFLQIYGNICRDSIHKDIWVKTLFSNWQPNWIITDARYINELNAISKYNSLKIKIIRKKTSEVWQEELKNHFIICDPIGWNKNKKYNYEWYEEKISLDEFTSKLFSSIFTYSDTYNEWLESINHLSEIEFNCYNEWDYVIDNDGTLDDLRGKIKDILIEKEII